ncbi:cerebellar degeneration-related protein 2-like [Anguilla rostrata]|uniref:cerebellar degeneration-related protein 2-like n=1 Tax=Anguilla rostrata TaxID=7938 RepID=UPI0030D2DDAA
MQLYPATALLVRDRVCPKRLVKSGNIWNTVDADQPKMLTDIIMAEEFEVKEDGPWYDRRDLEHDLRLAAELGKTLLERNHELEEGLQHMYSTSQEQQQEIEYLAKQVELLRQVNEQHAKVYEQLDEAARDLELGNQKLLQDKRSAQHRIHRLTDTIDGLQVHLEELQKQVEELQVSPLHHPSPARVEQKRLATQSMCCLTQLYRTHLPRCGVHDSSLDDDTWLSRETSLTDENSTLQRSIRTLRSQLGAERAWREEVEQEAESAAQENAELERQVAELEAACGREQVQALEAELEELRQHWRAEAGGAGKAGNPAEDALFVPLEEEAEPAEDAGAEEEVGPSGGARVPEGVLRSSSAEEIRRGHDLTCIRRAQAAKRRGVSLLSEVDAQYSALQVRYEELLRHCQQGPDGRSHKAVQTRDHSAAVTPTQFPCLDDDSQPPEYRALFQEIFTCIQRTRQDLSQAQ